MGIDTRDGNLGGTSREDAGALHPSDQARKGCLEAFTVDLDGQNLGRTENDEEKRLVDGRRLELPTSALRTRRSPN